MSNKFILLLGANQFQRERALIGAEKACQERIVTVSANVPFHNNKYSALTIQSVETSPEQLLKDVIKFTELSNMEPIAVIPLNDFVLNAGLAVAQHFKLSYNESTTIENCRIKDKMKTVLAQANLPVVISQRFSSYNEAQKIAEKIGYPLVVKPLNFGGSGGVKKVLCSDELEKVILETQEHLAQYAKQYDSDATQMLMEPYIKLEREISVEVINTPNFRKTIGITDKYLGEEPYFSEIAHMVPSSLYMLPDRAKAIENLAVEACAALNIQFGMAHVEIKISPDGNTPIIIEVGARPAGDGIMDLYEKATGKSLYELHCKAYLGRLREDELPKQFLRTSGVGYLHPEIGIIEKVNLQALDKTDLSNIDLITIKAEPQQQVSAAKNWSTRYGFIEYTFWDQTTENFDIVKNTKRLANKIFMIREKGD